MQIQYMYLIIFTFLMGSLRIPLSLWGKVIFEFLEFPLNKVCVQLYEAVQASLFDESNSKGKSARWTH
jgi:hypothetical protein